MDSCAFCDIVRGEAIGHWVYRDDLLLAFMNKGHQVVPGHVLLIPKTHAAVLWDLDEVTQARILPVASRIARAIKAEFNADGINLLQNNGAAADQEIDHFHLHLIPRRWGDDLWSRLSEPQRVLDQDLASWAATLRRRLAMIDEP